MKLTTKGTIFLTLVCVLMAGAMAQVNGTTLQVVRAPIREIGPQIINVDGMTGNIGLLPAQYKSTKDPISIPTTFEDVYQQKCRAVRAYLFNNVISLDKDLRIYNCVLEHREITYVNSASRHLHLIRQSNWIPVDLNAPVLD